jgi:endonuclease G
MFIRIFFFCLLTITPVLAQDSLSIHLLTGNPSNADTSGKNPDNYLMIKPQFAISYNRSRNIPNWVSWHLDSTDLGKTDRMNNFRPDTKLPTGWYRVKPKDYENSGFDKGHICPSGDRTDSERNNAATFLMTNMMPQAPENNRGVWKEFEEYCRRVVNNSKELYIIAGCYGNGGTGTNGKAKVIGTKVAVPSNTWKMILILDAGNDDLQRINEETRIIVIDIPNNNTVKGTKWRDYKITLEELEKRTGYHFLSALNLEIKKVLLTKMDKR